MPMRSTLASAVRARLLTTISVSALAAAGNAVAAETGDALRDMPLAIHVTPAATPPSDTRPASDFIDNYADDAGEAVFFAPGVLVNRHDANEPRLSIRGFGLSNRLDRSSLIVLRDGAPLTGVHGETNLREVDLLAVDRVDIHRGAGRDFRITGGDLGGVVDFISPTGANREAGATARLDGGVTRDGVLGGRAHVDLAAKLGSIWDFFVSLTGGYEDGARVNNRRNEAVVNGNVGMDSGAVATRFYFEVARSDFEIAGGLDRTDLRANPEAAGRPTTLGPLFPGGPVIDLAGGADDDRWGRETNTGRISNETVLRALGGEATVNLHYARRTADTAAIDYAGLTETDGSEWGAGLTLKRLFQFFGLDTSLRLGGGYARGEQDVDQFENSNGEAGLALASSIQRSKNLFGFVEAAAEPVRDLLVEIGAKFIRADREIEFATGTDDTRFTGVAARAGATYALRDDLQIYAMASRTYEPPTMAQLAFGAGAGFNSLDEQDAFTWELGVRGGIGDRLRWDVTYYNTDVEGEIVNLVEPETSGLGGALVNIDKTTHKGVEAALDIIVLGAPEGRRVTWRSAYAYNDFTFVDADPLPFDGARIAGAPEHLYRGEIRYDAGDHWYVAVNAEIAAGAYYVDHQNAVDAPTYNAVGFTAGMKLNEQAEIFLSGENATDLQYASGVTPVDTVTGVDARLYTPAQRATLYGGLRYRF